MILAAYAAGVPGHEQVAGVNSSQQVPPARHNWALLHMRLFPEKSEQISFTTRLTFFSCSLVNRHSWICSFSASISLLAVSSFSAARLLLASMSDCSWCICSKTASRSEKGETCIASVDWIKWELPSILLQQSKLRWQEILTFPPCSVVKTERRWNLNHPSWHACSQSEQKVQQDFLFYGV